MSQSLLLVLLCRLLILWCAAAAICDEQSVKLWQPGQSRCADQKVSLSSSHIPMSAGKGMPEQLNGDRSGENGDSAGKAAGRDAASESVGQDENPDGFEVEYVHGVYDLIADHFSSTRYKAWPKVAEFLNSIPDGSMVADIGCGNGKYLSTNPRLWMHGSDRSENLLQHCTAHKQDVLVADALCLPYKSNAFDAAISIAVIHHLSTEERRVAALREALRVIRPGGKLLVYNWAIEQEGRFGGFKEQDQLIPWHLNKRFGTDVVGHGEKKEEKQSVVYKRFYHLFKEGETERLFAEAGGNVLKEGYYDHANWCAVVEKT